MIVVSLTTIPSRINNLHYTINSIFNQSLNPNIIVVNIPLEYCNYKDTINIPEFLYRENIIINRVKDYGPATKLLGLYNSKIFNNMNNNDIIIIVDDDRIYNYNFIENFINYHKKYPDYVLTSAGWEIELLSHNKLKYNKQLFPRGIEFKDCGFIDILGGCCGFLLTKNMCPFNNKEIFNIDNNDSKFYQDDVIISGFLTINKTKIFLIVGNDEKRSINDTVNALASINGNFNRQNCNYNSIKHFIDNYNIWV
jgi:hypothetical protein